MELYFADNWLLVAAKVGRELGTKALAPVKRDKAKRANDVDFMVMGCVLLVGVAFLRSVSLVKILRQVVSGGAAAWICISH